MQQQSVHTEIDCLWVLGLNRHKSDGQLISQMVVLGGLDGCLGLAQTPTTEFYSKKAFPRSAEH